MKKTVLQLGVLLAMCFANLNVKAQDLYLIIGQSNASGRDVNAIDVNGADALTSNVKYYKNEEKFLKARQPLNRYSNIGKDLSLQGVNFGMEFGKEMYANTGNKVYLVVNARGGSKVAQWREGKSTDYFTDTRDRLIAAEIECGCELKGILWHQGEGNVSSSTGTFTSSYFSSLKGLINEFRAEFGDVPFIVGQLAAENAYNTNFNNALTEVDDANFGVSDVDWVSSSNLATLDGTHFTGAATRTLGQRYAAVMLNYYPSSSIVAPTVPTASAQNKNINESLDSKDEFQVFPNPANEVLNVSGVQENEILSVYNLLGTKVIETNTSQIDISSLESGIYLVIGEGDRRRKFIKK